MTTVSDDAGKPEPEVEIWFVDVAKSGAALQTWEQRTQALDTATKARLEAIQSEEDRATRFAVHCGLRVLIGRSGGPHWHSKPLHYASSGRPSLPGLGCAFSLSHSSGAGLVAISSSHDIGVDLEVRDRAITMSRARQRAIIAMVQRLQSPPEQRDNSRDLTFLSAWVRLEAYAKATGIGLGPLLTQALAGLRSTQHQMPASENPAADQTAHRDDNFLVERDTVKVCGLAVHPKFEAAVACAGLVEEPELKMFPTTAEAIERLLGG